jgi:M6 family metalloprotease-like protein
MLTKVVNVSQIAGEKIQGPVTSWKTPNGPYTIEHLAGRDPTGQLLVFYWSPAHDWQVVNVTRKTGSRVVTRLTSWQTPSAPHLVEHLAGIDAAGNLLVFYWTPGSDWRVVNVSAITGQKVQGPVTSWQTPSGPYNIEHLAGMSPHGDLLVFWWSPHHDWQVVNVTRIAGPKIKSSPCSWTTLSGPVLVEHLAAQGTDDSLLVFWWSSAHDWQAVNVSNKTSRKVSGSSEVQISGPVTAWQTQDEPYNVEHLAGRGTDGSLLVFWWSPQSDWQCVDVSSITGEGIGGTPASYQLTDGSEHVELLAAPSQNSTLLLHWWRPSLDWQVLDLSAATGQTILSNPEAWLTPDGPNLIEHLAAQGPNNDLLVFWGDGAPRRWIDGLSEPFGPFKRTRNVRRKVIAILWDFASATPSKQSIEDILFGPANSVRDYYLQNSNGYFTIEKAGVLGWYAADKPASHYAAPPDTTDADHDGWVNGHVEKWAEAIRKAAVDFAFEACDTNPADGHLDPKDELAILIVMPGTSAFGTNRVARGREYPISLPLVVDGVHIGLIAEVYIGTPLNLGICAHELAHLLMDHGDMYFPFFQPYAAGDYSLMDRSYKTTHFDPFAKLKLGWLRARLILRSGTYTLPDIETRHVVWVLMNPERSTSEYFLVENRWRGNSYDREMGDPGGLAVWHIIEDQAVYGALPPPPGVTAADWATVGKGEWARRGIRMIRPILGPPFNDGNALWKAATGYNLESNDTNAQHGMLRWADGSSSGFAIRQISASGTDMTAFVEVPQFRSA